MNVFRLVSLGGMGLANSKGMLTVRDLKREAAKHNATIEDDSSGRWLVYQCCTPFGKVWKAIDGKHIPVQWPHGSLPKDKEEVLRDGIQRMNNGIRDMTAEERFECDEEPA